MTINIAAALDRGRQIRRRGPADHPGTIIGCGEVGCVGAGLVILAYHGHTLTRCTSASSRPATGLSCPASGTRRRRVLRAWSPQQAGVTEPRQVR